MELDTEGRLALTKALDALDTCIANQQRIYEDMTETLRALDRNEARWEEEVEAEAERLSAVEAMN